MGHRSCGLRAVPEYVLHRRSADIQKALEQSRVFLIGGFDARTGDRRDGFCLQRYPCRDDPAVALRKPGTTGQRLPKQNGQRRRRYRYLCASQLPGLSRAQPRFHRLGRILHLSLQPDRQGRSRRVERHCHFGQSFFHSWGSARAVGATSFRVKIAIPRRMS